MREDTRKRFTFKNFTKSFVKIFKTEELVYSLTTDGATLLFKTDPKYEEVYDRCLSQTNRISCYVECKNKTGNKIVISDIRYLRVS